MGQQQGGGGGGGGDNSMAPIWLTLIFLLVAYFTWQLGKKYIVAFSFQLTIWQAKVVLFFVTSPVLVNDIYVMQTLDPALVTWKQFLNILNHVGIFTRYPIALILVALAFVLYKSNITLKYRRTHSMQTLRTQEQVNWPAIMPVAKVDIVSQDLNKGPWATALTPLEFAQKYNLLKKPDPLIDKTAPGLEMTACVRRGDAKRIFTLQLGPYWEGFEHCPPHTFALATVFLARINRDKKSASLILETLDRTVAQGKPDFNIARPIFKKYAHNEEVQETIAKHAYLLTVMASLIEMARLDGVVPSSEFLWLKTVDRRLWYMLNSVGRQTPFSEVAGPFAHWKAEKAMTRSSLVPMIDEATKALEVAIKEIKLTPKVFKDLSL